MEKKEAVISVRRKKSVPYVITCSVCDSVLSLQILMLADQIFTFFRLGYYNPELSTNV